MAVPKLSQWDNDLFPTDPYKIYPMDLPLLESDVARERYVNVIAKHRQMDPNFLIKEHLD